MSRQSPAASNTQDDSMSAEEKAAIVDALLDEMRTLFHEYVTGTLAYDELSFEMFDTLQTVHAIANDALIVEYDMDDLAEDVIVEQPTPRQRQKGRSKHGN